MDGIAYVVPRKRYFSNVYGSTYTQTYTADKSYVNLTSDVWNKSQLPVGVLPPGEHFFQFRFLIPPEVPSSHEGVQNHSMFRRESKGWIRYTLRGIIQRRHPYQDHVIETQLNVNKIVDINIPNLRVPFRAETQQTVGFLCCAKGAITATLELPRAGYCVGEYIPFRITIENESDRVIRATAALEEDVCYFAEGRSSQDPIITLAQITSEAAQPHQTTVWVPNSQTFKVPTTAHTTMDSNLVKRSFMFRATIHISSFCNPILQSRIYIGNVTCPTDTMKQDLRIHRSTSLPLPPRLQSLPEVFLPDQERTQAIRQAGSEIQLFILLYI